MDKWYIPITILPGICLLILSTSNLLIALNQEIFQLSKDRAHILIVKKKIGQLERLSKAMVFFYVSCALMVLSGILSAFESRLLNIDFGFLSMISGVLITLAGLLFLIRYALHAVSIRKTQHQMSITEEEPIS